MKNKLFMFVAMLASVLSLASCSSDEIEGVDSNQAVAGKGVSITVALKPESRAVYTDNGTNLKATFEKDVDYITVFFRKGTSPLGKYKLTCTGVSSMGGTFTSNSGELTAEVLKQIMTGGELTDLHMILASAKSKPDFYEKFNNDLSVQDGTLEDATAHMQRVTNHDMTKAENYEWDDANARLTVKNVNFNSNPELCTSILKVKAVFPAGTELVKGETPIDLYGENAYSKYTCGWGKASGATITNGTVPFTKAKVAEVQENADGTKTAIAYVCFWPTTAKPLELLNVNSKIGDVDYTGEYTVEHVTMSGEEDVSTLKGAKLYTMPITLAGSKTITQWMKDGESSIEVAGATLESSEATWLTFEGGRIHVAANATGAPRTGEIDLKAGGIILKYVITQLEPNDFKGTYSYTTKVFAGTGAITGASDPYTFEGLIFGEPRTSAELTDANGTKHTNNIGITGLYGTAVLDACLEIDYENCSAKFGVFLDARDGQNQQVNGKYVAFVPALVTRKAKDWGKPWMFYETEFGDPDYTWAWYTVTKDLSQIIYYNRTNNNVEFSSVPQYSSNTMNQIAGIDVVLSSTDVFTHATVSGYAQVYQVNAKGKVGSYFMRTGNASGAKTNANGITAAGYTIK